MMRGNAESLKKNDSTINIKVNVINRYFTMTATSSDIYLTFVVIDY